MSKIDAAECIAEILEVRNAVQRFTQYLLKLPLPPADRLKLAQELRRLVIREFGEIDSAFQKANTYRFTDTIAKDELVHE